MILLNRSSLAAALAAGLVVVSARAESLLEHLCHWSLEGAPADSSEFRKYAPNREMDILHLALDVTPDFKARTVAGKATLKFKPIARPMTELRLDAIELAVSAVEGSEKIASWQVTDERIIITFAEPVAAGREASVTVTYVATPRKGLYFRTPEMGFREDEIQLWTQGEPTEARNWYPCFDAPNEKFTSEVTCHVPEGYVALSNGKKVSEETKDGQTTAHWLQDKPHSNYLMALAAGKFAKVEDTHRGIPMALWVPPAELPQAKETFKDTKDMMVFFEREIGVPYPWAKYDQVCALDYHWGGMENTTLTVLNVGTLHTANTENLRSSQGLVAHELAHQWFGDFVTCKDWSHLWLNEGFATYYEMLYAEYKDGRDEYLHKVYTGAKAIYEKAADNKSIVYRRFGDPEEQFGYLAYGKGAQVLHMLRSQLGADLYRRCVKTYLERHAFGNVVTEDFNSVIEELSGRSWDQFFDQFVYNPRHPDLDVEYSWDGNTKLAKLTVRQTHPTNENVAVFRFPLTVRFKSKSGVVEQVLEVKERTEDFYIPLVNAPEIVRLNPELSVLAKINFRPTAPMLQAQLADASDALGRYQAIELLDGRKDADTLAKLKTALNGDAFYAVRLRACDAIRAMKTDEAYEVLSASTKQSDARVRRAVVSAIGSFYREATPAKLREIVRSEKNPDIVSTATLALAPYAKPEVRELLLAQLRSKSYKESLAESAISALRAQDDPAALEPLFAVLRERETEFESRTQAIGLSTLAWLARKQENKEAVREFLAARTSSKRRAVQLAAINGLGTLEDPRAISVLETFSSAPKDSAERKAAEKAIADIRAGKKPSVELGDLRREVLDLQKENREMKREFEALKKKLDAMNTKPVTNAPVETKKKR